MKRKPPIPYPVPTQPQTMDRKSLACRRPNSDRAFERLNTKPPNTTPPTLQMADTDRAFEHFDSDFDGHVDIVEFYEGLAHLPGMAEVKI